MSDDTETDRTEPTTGVAQDNTVDWARPETWPAEVGGVEGPEPTRYGDWERNGRCSDFCKRSINPIFRRLPESWNLWASFTIWEAGGDGAH